jgi:hypothetical protein
MKFRDIGYRLQDAFRKVMWGGVITGVLGGFGTYMYGLPNGDGRSTLENIGVKVVEDKGHPAFGMGGGSGLFSSTFTIETKDGGQEDVVVSRGLTNRTSITFGR